MVEVDALSCFLEISGKLRNLRADGKPSVRRGTSIIKNKDFIKNFSCPALSSLSKMNLDSLSFYFFFDEAHNVPPPIWGLCLLGECFPLSFLQSPFIGQFMTIQGHLCSDLALFSLGNCSSQPFVCNKFSKL